MILYLGMYYQQDNVGCAKVWRSTPHDTRGPPFAWYGDAPVYCSGVYFYYTTIYGLDDRSILDFPHLLRRHAAQAIRYARKYFARIPFFNCQQ